MLLLALSLALSEPTDLCLVADKVFTMNAEDRVHQPGMVIVRDGAIEYVGPPIEAPDDLTLQRMDGWLVPGMIDLHSHIVTDGWGGINDMVLPVNSELSVRSTIRPANSQMRTTCASGVTTLFLIPGSGTSLSGAGVLFKTRTQSTYEEAVLADPGGVKVAQTHNPERSAGDIGQTRAGLYWTLSTANRAAASQTPDPSKTMGQKHLRDVLAGDLPLLVHCAGSDGVAATVRMWRDEFPTRSVLSHGSFDGWMVADYVAAMGMPVNHGPRTMDYRSSRNGRINATSKAYVDAGVPNFSLNTDAPVIPAWELFLQGTVSARQGCDGYNMLRALTIHPARAFGIDDRVGSLEPGKHADLVVFSGDPLDPRSRVERVWIEGSLQYDRETVGQWF